MDDPASAVVTHATSATLKRLVHLATTGVYVSRTTVHVLRVWRSTDSTIRRWRSVARDDGERTATGRCSDALEDLDELGIDTNLPRAMVGKLPAAEVWTQIAHACVYAPPQLVRVVAFSPRRR